MLKLGWFSTGRGEGSKKLFQLVQNQITKGDLQANILFVFCNRDPGETEPSDQFHTLVQSCEVPLVTLSSQGFRRERQARDFNQVRKDFDREALRRLDGFNPDLVVLAGYMLFTAAELCEHFNLINLHPAPPGGPKGTWQEVIWQLIEQRANSGGAQIQLATMDWDQGPIITHTTFSLVTPEFKPLWDEIDGRTIEELKSIYQDQFPLFHRIREEGLKREAPLLLETIRAFAQGKIRIEYGSLVDSNSNVVQGFSLNNEIETWLRS